MTHPFDNTPEACAHVTLTPEKLEELARLMRTGPFILPHVDVVPPHRPGRPRDSVDALGYYLSGLRKDTP